MASNAAPDVASVVGANTIGVPLICRNSTMFKIRQSRSGWRNSSVIQPSVMKTNNATEDKKVRERARYTGSKALKDPSDADDLKGDDSLIVDAESCEQTSTLKNAVPTIDLLSNLSSEEKGSSEFTKPLRFYPTNDSSRHTASRSGDVLHPTSSKELPQKGNYILGQSCNLRYILDVNQMQLEHRRYKNLYKDLFVLKRNCPTKLSRLKILPVNNGVKLEKDLTQYRSKLVQLPPISVVMKAIPRN